MPPLLLALHLATSCNGCDYPDPVSAAISFFAHIEDGERGQLRARVQATLAPRRGNKGTFAGTFVVEIERTQMQLVAITLIGPDGGMAANLVTSERAESDAAALAEEWAFGADVGHDAAIGPFALAPGTGTPGPVLFTQYSDTDVEVQVLSPAAFGPEVRFDLEFALRGTRVTNAPQSSVRFPLPVVDDGNVVVTTLKIGRSLRHAEKAGRTWPIVATDEEAHSFVVPAQSMLAGRGEAAAFRATDRSGAAQTFVDARYHAGDALVPQRRPVAFVFVFDASASLDPKSGRAAYALARRTMAAAPEDSVFAAVRFARHVRVPLGPWRARGDRAALTQLKRSHHAQNGSAIAGALDQATRIAADAPPGTDVRIVVFSDFRQPAFAPTLLGHPAGIEVAFVDISRADASTPLAFSDERTDASDDPRDALRDGAWRIYAEDADAPVMRPTLHTHLVAPRRGAVVGLSVGGATVPTDCIADADATRDDEDTRVVHARRTWRVNLMGTCDDLNHRPIRPATPGTLTLETWRGVHQVPLPHSEPAARTVAALAMQHDLSTSWNQRLSSAYGLSSPQHAFFVATPWRAPRRAAEVEVVGYGCGSACSGIGMSCGGCTGCGWRLDASPHPAALVAMLNKQRRVCGSDDAVSVDVADGEILDVFSTDPTRPLDACVRERVWAVLIQGEMDPGPDGIYQSEGEAVVRR